MTPSRRAVLRSALALAAAAWVPGRAFAEQRPRFVDHPFRLGVASGYPRPDGVTLWTRLVPVPWIAGGGMEPTEVAVRWEVAEDEAFGKVVAAGKIGAFWENGHAVHVDVRGLAPGRWYFYRFFVADELSPVGRTRTAEAPGQGLDRLRVGFGSCQHYEQGWYVAQRALARENLDLCLFLGDYIYEATWGSDLVRRYATGEPYELEGYRQRWAQHKHDADLQALHQAAPCAAVWDDHEIDNDWAGEVSEHLDPRFLLRRAAAFQAFFEHLPLPRALRAAGRVHAELAFGELARVAMLDARSWRAPQACPPEGQSGSTVVSAKDCPALFAPDRAMLGAAQEAWLDGLWAQGRHTWSLVGQQTLVTSQSAGAGPERRIWTDGWEAYPAARRKLTEVLRKAPNPLVLGGDTHCGTAADLRLDPDDPRSPVVAAELCGTSFTSEGRPKEAGEQMMKDHPDIRWASSHQRGYTVVELGKGAAEAAFKVVDEKRPTGEATVAARFRVEAGRRGLVPA